MKPLNETLGKVLRESGIDMNKLKEAAQRLAKERPELEEHFRQQAQSQAFQKLVDNVYDDIEDMLEHEDTPNDAEK